MVLKENTNKSLSQKNNDTKAYLNSTSDEKDIQITKLIKEKEYLLKLLDTLPVMVCLLTPDYYVTYANKAFRNKFGEAKGRHCYEYCFGWDRPCDFCESYNVLKTGKSHFWQCKSPDGKSVINAYDFPFTDMDGSPMILEMDVDITFKQKEIADIKKYNDTINILNKRLQAQFDELEAIYSFAPVGLYVLDDNLRYLKVNKRFAEFVKIPSPKLLGKTIRDVVPSIAGASKALAEKVLATNEPVLNIEISGVVPAEPKVKRYWLESWYPLKNIKKIIVVTQDITERKTFEKLKRKTAYERIEMLEKKKVARELHDTVSQILFSSNLLSESLVRSWKNENPQKTLGVLKKIRDLNNSALSEMRIILYELMPQNIKNQNLEKLIKGVAEILTSNSDIEVDIKVTGSYKCSYKIKREIHRIAEEAIRNIVKHSQASKINIRLKQKSSELSLVISDNGIGFDTKARSFGKNFGLNIMKDRAKSIGASFTIESSPGKGTTLSIYKKSK